MPVLVLGDSPGTQTAFVGLHPTFAARGLVAETGNPNSSIGGVAVTDGVIHFVGVGLFGGTMITGAAISIVTAGVALTLSKVGLYTKAGARLALSAEQGTAWQTIGSYTIPFTAAIVVPSTDMYYAALICKGGTPAAPFRTGQSMSSVGAVNSGALPMGIQSGQTDLISSATIAIGSGAPPVPWIGLY